MIWQTCWSRESLLRNSIRAISKMSYLLSLTSRIKKTQAPPPAPAPAPAPEPQIVEVAFLSVSESVEVVQPSTSEVETVAPELAVEETPTEAPSEEQCASPPAPASTASSHTEESC
jgi:hypothetical protein